MSEEKKLSEQESIKVSSRFLRGNLAAELADPNPFVSDESYELLKFHGSYQGYDRDSATARKKQGLDKLWEFMVRLKVPGGRMSAAQYLAMDEVADKFANGTLRITTRQTFQFHCIVKPSMKPMLAEINRNLLSTLGGCGDVVRNVTSCPSPEKNKIQETLTEAAFSLARHFAPKTGAYLEVWLDEKSEDSGAPDEVEPIYTDRYMPRKFKIGVARPEDNCVDLLTHDLAMMALFEDGEHKGYNVAVGGGLGMNHNNPKTYPRLASQLAFIKPDELLPAAEAVVKLQRDFGDRSDRKHARLKYVVEEKGLEWTKTTFEKYFGKKAEAPLPISRWGVESHLGWHEQGCGKWFLGVPVSSGRIADFDYAQIRTGLRTIISQYKMPIVLTADQNIILCDIETQEKPAIEALLKKHGIKLKEELTPVFQNFLACVALPTCGKALSEAERVKLPLVAAIEEVMKKSDVIDERIAIRISGCPNACSRPFVGDIGIVGRTPDHYTLYIGGDFEGTRLNAQIFDKVPLGEIPEALSPMFAFYSGGKNPGEGFGDFVNRVGLDAVKKMTLDKLSAKYKWAA